MDETMADMDQFEIECTSREMRHNFIKSVAHCNILRFWVRDDACVCRENSIRVLCTIVSKIGSENGGKGALSLPG